MLHQRKIVAAILLCAVLVGLSAFIRANGNSSVGRLRANVTDAVGGFAETQKLSIEEAFFASTNQKVSEDPAVKAVKVTVLTPATRPSAPRPPADTVTATAYVVGDVRTGKIYIEKNASAVLPFASMSKLITAIVATEAHDTSEIVTISASSTEVAPDASNLKADERFTVKELLYPMLMNSSNVAAEALSSLEDRPKFLELMSGYAWEIGMPDSFFADPTGLSPRNAGTARGFFAMAKYIYEKRPDILEITRTQELKVATTTDHGAHTFTNIHPFVADPRFVGGKTGRTPQALETMLTILNIKDHTIAIIVLRSDGARARDTGILIDRVSKVLTNSR